MKRSILCLLTFIILFGGVAHSSVEQTVYENAISSEFETAKCVVEPNLGRAKSLRETILSKTIRKKFDIPEVKPYVSMPSLAEEIRARQLSESSLARKSLRVLSIDGGGIRGILPLYFLAKLEEMTGKRTCEIFDVIGGTSTGGMIALALSIASAQDVLNLYLKHGDEIFLKSKGIFGPKYSSKNRRKIFREFFGQYKLSQAEVPTIVTAWELERDRAFHLYSKWPDETLFAHEHLDMLMSDAALATSAAPTYFVPEVVRPLKVDGMPSNSTYTFLDGGVFANNPAMITLNYAMTLYPQANHTDIDLLSLGTGYQSVDFDGRKAKRWGKLGWINPLIHILLSGTSKSIDDDLSRLLNERYDRVTTALVHAHKHLDRTGDNIRSLQLDAELMVNQNSRALNRWISKAMMVREKSS